MANTALALIAFALNSLLCRMALGRGHIDAATFTSVRLLSGAIGMFLLTRVKGEKLAGGTWRGAIALAAYAILFSFAYLRLITGAGALILFGAVQLTLISLAVKNGERPRALEWIGLAIALAGLALLTMPGANAPDPIGAVSMAGAGIAWGLYTWFGKRSSAPPLSTTAENFLRAVPFALAVSAISFRDAHFSKEGIALAVASGAIASGVGYTLWYTALKNLSATQAGILQLSVPAIAASAGVIILDEAVPTRLLAAGPIIIAGIALAIVARARRA